MTSVFVSYARGNHEPVKSLALDLIELDYQVWYDNELTGGQAWWDHVLLKIRECDIFVFGLSPDSLDSQACRLERTYARSVEKSIVPILVADKVELDLLPVDLAQIHFVDYRAADKRSLISLLKAIKRLPPPRPLPSPLPETPAVPVSYLGNLKERLEVSQLSSQEQAELLLTLKRGLKDAKGKSGALTLLRQMRTRQDLFAWIGEEIDELIGAAADSTPQLSPLPAKAAGPGAISTPALSPLRSIEVRAPEIGDQKTPALVTKIMVKAGDVVQRDLALVELEYDKAVTEVPAPRAGIVKKILVQVGDQIAIGGSLLVLAEEDWSNALNENRLAAERGDNNAQYTLGRMYHEGLGVPADYTEAAKWNRKAAEGGHREAQYHLGVMHVFGRGVAKDKQEAVKWFRKAADQGHAGAQFNLGLRYLNAEGLQRDEKQAVRWFQKAAQQGHAKAQAELQKRGLKWSSAK